MKNKIFYKPNKTSLKNKIILFIKTQETIENTLIKSLINCGAKIIVLEESINKLSKLYDKIEMHQKKNIFLYPINISNYNEKDFYKLTNNLYKNFGRLDSIIYNLPKIGKSYPQEQYETQELYKIMNINFYSKFIIMKTIIPLIKLSKNPSIIFTTYTIKILNAYWCGYACSNSALQTLIKTIYKENETISNIKINQIQLQNNKINIHKQEFPGIVKNIPDIKIITNIYIYLISNKNKKIRNKILTIDKNTYIYKK